MIIIFFNDSLVFNVDNNRACQNIAEIPDELYNVQGAFSGLSPNGAPLICGGQKAQNYLTTCFELTLSKKWVQYNHHFNIQRAFGASAKLDEMLVAAVGGTPLGRGLSVEVLTTDGWQTTTYTGSNNELFGVCAVAVNSSMMLIINRYGTTKFFDINMKEFDDGPALLNPRANSACGLHKKSNCVLVVGGIDLSNSDMHYYNTQFSEVLFMGNETLKWQQGPGLPQSQDIPENVLTIADRYFKIIECFF